METFKKIDWIVQAFLILGSLLLVIASSETRNMYFSFYFAVGGWQLMSVIVHLINKWKFNNKLRTVYLWMLGIVLVTGIISMLITIVVIYYFIALLFVSPIMALLYLATCYLETKEISTRIAA